MTSQYFLILGPAGSGISTALDAFSNFGFIQVGDVPASKFESVFSKLSQDAASQNFAFTLTLSPEDETSISAVANQLKALKAKTPELKILTLTAPDAVLVQRYITSGRSHRFGQTGLQQGVAQEKQLYSQLSDLKDYAIDTSATSTGELRNKIAKVLGLPEDPQPFSLNICTFGFKYGLPLDAELVFDMRFIKNPFYIDELRPQTGLDQPVKDYIFAQSHVQSFFETWRELVAQMLPFYQTEGKTRLNIAIGCTGGKHRSVCLAEALAAYLKTRFPEYNIAMHHREAHRWDSQKKASDTVSSSRASCSVS